MDSFRSIHETPAPPGELTKPNLLSQVAHHPNGCCAAQMDIALVYCVDSILAHMRIL